MTVLLRLLAVLWLLLLFSFPNLFAGKEVFADENPLPLLPGLEEAVEFWKVVFTRYGSSEAIFHDPLEPMKIYKVLDVGEDNPARRLIEEERGRILRERGQEGEDKKIRVQRGVKERFASGLKLSRRYLEQMQRIFSEQGLPTELAYLPLVESSFDIRARSRAGALGLWQFMPSTGKKFLRVTSAVDERRDPVESTRAAARFLRQNYEVFGNWPLAITAYNHGREGILRAIAEVGSRDLMEIIRRYQGPSFGFASKSFYAEFLAALEVVKKSEEFFPNLEYHPPLLLEEIELKRSVSLGALLKPTDIARSEFLDWNPALSPKIRDIPRGYRVKVPAEKLELLLAAYRRVAEPSVMTSKSASVDENGGSWTRHRVAPGETLSQIAKAYRITVHEIQHANRLASAHLIAAGRDLRIPKR
ncbi:MAG: transglycosylase SLT domain-containing protein [Deltaproteobacteria bacterium]|nr:transglycosylase SLT domain-containing protein [Deltaproteobacteria bacterium]